MDYSVFINEFVYKVSCFDGINEVCFVLCDEFGICDIIFYIFEVNVVSIMLLVYDDFFYDGFVLMIDLWFDQEVYVNIELVIDLFLIGVVIFDGIDNCGCLYGGGYGFLDCLIFIYFNISSGNWVFLFYLQCGGLSDCFEICDSFVFQFCNDDDNWVMVCEFLGILVN